MAMLCTRTGTPLTLLPKTFESAKINIPKAPALGLLLDRPVFKLYNDRMQAIDGRNTIDFDQYKARTTAARWFMASINTVSRMQLRPLKRNPSTPRYSSRNIKIKCKCFFCCIGFHGIK